MVEKHGLDIPDDAKLTGSGKFEKGGMTSYKNRRSNGGYASTRCDGSGLVNSIDLETEISALPDAWPSVAEALNLIMTGTHTSSRSSVLLPFIALLSVPSVLTDSCPS